MPVTMEQVTAALLSEEPSYNEAKQLGPDALVHLEELVRRSDPALASKATYLAGLIGSDRSVAIIREAARSSRAELRVAAAAAARHLPLPEISNVLSTLLVDGEISVRKIALKSVPINAPADLRRKIEELARNDQEIAIRELSQQTLRGLQ
jgi:HEAT repeat protein